MPDDPTIRTPHEFCLALKAARERRGVSVAAIAAATKVCPSHFVALERNDLRRWPKGLFRRAFFRGYVEMIGLPVAETMDEFVRLFPDDTASAAIQPAQPLPAANALPLSLDSSWHGARAPIASRIVTAVSDAVAVIVLAAALVWLAGTNAATTTAIVSVSYFTLATVLLGDRPTAWVIGWFRTRASVRREVRLRLAASARQAEPDEPVPAGSRVAAAWQRVVAVIAVAFERTEDHASEEARVPEERVWTTDARRVRPRDVPPRLRVRFKLSQ